MKNLIISFLGSCDAIATTNATALAVRFVVECSLSSGDLSAVNFDSFEGIAKFGVATPFVDSLT